MDRLAADPPATSPVSPSADWDSSPAAAALRRPFQAPADFHPPPFRRLVHGSVVAVCLFLLIRTVGVEPFGVPTGSMAPALIGNHREAFCTRCGAPVVVGEPAAGARPADFARCRCPNCGAPADLSEADTITGDRLLVDKTAFLARPPRRWEVAVFRCPVDDTKPYVKRVAGLPGELIQISDGDVYADGELVRKSLSDLREVLVPVLDMNSPPRPDGWGTRWLVEPVPAPPTLPAVGRPDPQPADAAVLADTALVLDAANRSEGVGLTYRHWNLDRRCEEPVGYALGYNGGPAGGRSEFAAGTPACRDFVLTFDLEVVAGAGSFACRLGDGADWVSADLPVGNAADSPGVQVAHDGGARPVTGPGRRLDIGKTYRVEFAFADRRASLAIDGEEVVPPLDLPADPPGRSRRRPLGRPAQLGARGVTATVRNLRLDRDIHYLPGSRGVTAAWRLGPGEYFLLGDNTANSQDSREWQAGGDPRPGVPEADFVGKPFLIHQPMRLARVTVNGRDRVFQTVDWSRMRWLR